MPIRTTDVKVKQIMAPGGDFDVKRNPSLVPFITAAAKIVDRLVARGAELDTAISDEDAELVETWLSAWAYCTSDRIYNNRSTQGASGGFHLPQAGPGLDSNPYGRMAKAMDPTGLLEEVINAFRKPVVGGVWLGTPPESQPGYWGVP